MVITEYASVFRNGNGAQSMVLVSFMLVPKVRPNKPLVIGCRRTLMAAVIEKAHPRH